MLCKVSACRERLIRSHHSNAQRSPGGPVIPSPLSQSGAATMPRRDPAKAMQVFDTMLEFFDGGRRWAQEEMVTGDGQARCLVGCGTFGRNMAFAATAPFTICGMRCRNTTTVLIHMDGREER
jgi:hypothetical protein